MSAPFPSGAPGTNREPTAAEIADALKWADFGNADPVASKHINVLAAFARRQQISEVLTAVGRPPALKVPADALNELAAFACANRRSTSGILIRDIFAAIYGCGGPFKFGAITRLDDRHCANLVSALDGLLVGSRGRIYDVHIKAAFAKNGGEDFLFAAG